MIDFEELKNKWNTLPEPLKLDLLAYVTALMRDGQSVPEYKQKDLEERLNRYMNGESAISWGHIYNKMLEELI